MFKRILDIPRLIQSKGQMLLGPRQTGKSTLLRGEMPNAIYFDLLDNTVYASLLKNPTLLSEWIAGADRPDASVVIDEIQKLPELLDEVHRIVSSQKTRRFIVTGSSARKLRKAGVNLLGGRLSLQKFHALVYPECADIPVERRLQFGSLPHVLLSNDPAGELLDYTSLYIKEEIRDEGFVRNLNSFSQFLDVMATCAAEQINCQSVGRDAQVPGRTVQDFIELLVDTLIGTQLRPYRSKKRKPVSSSKFYFFDVGVANALATNQKIPTGVPELDGKRLEHLIHDEMSAYCDYKSKGSALTYWRTQDGLEVDFILDSALAVEVKRGGSALKDKDLAGLRAFEEEAPGCMKILVSLNESRARLVEGKLYVLPVRDFLERLWSGKLTP